MACFRLPASSTSSSKQSTHHEATDVQARLDRATANSGFISMFPNTVVQHIVIEETDHAVLLIKVVGDSGPTQCRRKGFMFEEMWTKHDEYDDMVYSAWEAGIGTGHGLHALWERLHNVSASMKKWSFHTFGSVLQQIKRLKASLEEAKIQAMVSGSFVEVRALEKELLVIYEREEVMYK
jgi:hypothetical protein